MAKRCVVTGVGVVSPIGSGKEAFWKSLTEGRSGIAPITYFDAAELPVKVAGEVKDFDLSDYIDESSLPKAARYTAFAVGAAKMALADAGISSDNAGNSRLSLVLGTSSPSMDILENHIAMCQTEESPHLQTHPFAVAATIPHAPALSVSHIMRLFDSILTVSTVCTSGFNAIATGVKEIKSGRKDVVLAGSTESTLMYCTFIGYIAAGLLNMDSDIPPEKVMRPFDKDRGGGVLSEGAAIVVLEELEHARLRGAPIYGEVAGLAVKDKFRGSKQDTPIKQGMIITMKEALSDARIPPSEVDYVSANGVSTAVLDKMETLALKEIFGDYAYRFPVSSIKSMIGIPNSAIGPMQLIAALLSFQTDIIPPTINYESPDPECDLDYVPNVARVNRIDVALVNNHALDGGDAALVARRYEG